MTTTVTGNLKNLGTGTITAGGFVRFWLRGCGGNQPRVNGTAIIGPSQNGVFYFDINGDGSGNVTGTIYSTRDSTGLLGGDIEAGGSKTSEWYGMQVYLNGKAGPEVPVQAKNGATLDITNVTPITTTPAATAPSGDSTYARLDAGNQPFTGGITLPKLNNILFADQYASIQAAINALPAGGGTVIVPQGTYTITSSISTVNGLRLIGIGKNAQLLGAAGIASGNGIINVTSSDVEIANLYFNGNNAVSGMCGLQFSSSTRAHVHDNFIDGCTYGMNVNNANVNLTIDHNTIGNSVGTQYGIHGQQLNDCHDLYIGENTLLGNQNAIASGDGISMDAGTATTGHEPYNIHLCNNFVTGYTQISAGGSGVGGARIVTGLVITGNISQGNIEGIHVEDDCKGFIVADNYCYGNSRAGINVICTAVSGRALPRNGTISGNSALVTGATASYAGIMCGGTGPATGMTVVGNTSCANLNNGFIMTTLTNGSFIGNEASGNSTADYNLSNPSGSTILYHSNGNFQTGNGGSAETGLTVGRDTTSNTGMVSVNFKHTKEQGLVLKDLDTSQVWSQGPNVGGPATDAYGWYDQTGAALRFALTKTGTANAVGTYNGIATVAGGIPAEYAVIDLTAQTAAKTATLLYAVPAGGQGRYRVSWVATITTAATTSSVLGGTNGFQVQFTSPTDSVVKTSNPTTVTAMTSAANTTATTVSGTFNVYAKLSTNINYLFDYTSVGGTPMAYELHIVIEAM